MNRQSQTLKRNAMLVALAGLTAFGVAACNQEPGKSPMKPSQGFNTTPDTTQQGAGGMPSGTAVADVNRPVEAVNSSDGSLAASVKSAIVAEPTLRSMALDVSAQDGVVTLRGTAGTDAERERAARLAMNVDGVRSVKNELVIVRGS